MKQKLLSLLLMSFLPIAMMAYDVEVNGIYYNLNTSANTASVTFENSSDYNSYSGDVVIPETFAYNGVTYQVTSIEDYAFYLCSDLTSISIPNNVVSIGEYAFDGCTSLPVEDNIRYAGPYLVGPVDREQTTYTIKAGTKYIGTGAFAGCYYMTSIIIPSSITSIGKYAFEGCTSLPVEGNIRYAGPYLVEAADKSQTTYTIKEGTKYIGELAFADCANLVSIIIPSSVTRIEDYAFANCYSLSSVTISKGVKEIDYGIFDCCTSLTSINIPSSVTSIEDAAFMNLGLTSITVASENTIYDSRNNCNAIIETSSNTLIAGCGNTVIPESVTSIGVSAFQNCTNLTSITIPKNVTEIGLYAISIDPNNCLTTVICEATTPPTCEDTPFSDLSNVTLYVPATSINAYKAADFWKDFGRIQPINISITIGSTGYATYCSEYDLDFNSVTDFKAYIVVGYNKKSGNVTVVSVKDAPAGTGLLLKGTSGTYQVPCGESGSIYSNMLVGVTKETIINTTDGTYTNFTLQNGSKGVGFYAVKDNHKMAAYRAYLQIPNSMLSSSANQVGLEFEEGVTSINEANMLENEKDVWCSLDGRQLNSKPTKKGIYVTNGRKVVIK